MKEKEFGAMFENIPIIVNDELPKDILMMLNPGPIVENIKKLGLEEAIKKAHEGRDIVVVEGIEDGSEED